MDNLNLKGSTFFDTPCSEIWKRKFVQLLFTVRLISLSKVCLRCVKVGYAMTTYNEETGQAVIGFDMGGIEIHCIFCNRTIVLCCSAGNSLNISIPNPL